MLTDEVQTQQISMRRNRHKDERVGGNMYIVCYVICQLLANRIYDLLPASVGREGELVCCMPVGRIGISERTWIQM